MNKIYLQLGSNKGDRFQYLATARKQIEIHIGPIEEVSEIYETAAWGVKDQNDFFNQVIAIKTYLRPFDLMRRLQKIEVIIGKGKETHWGPRNIDIDILFYGSEVFQGEKLRIPHPQIGNRRFVLQPMKEIAPDFIHPEKQLSIRQMLEKCTDQGAVRKYTEKNLID